VAPRSAGLLLYRQLDDGLEVLLAHPGGPLWESRDAGAWSLPKGELEPGEEPLDVARREFEEETGTPAPPLLAGYRSLGDVRQKSGKVVSAWAVPGGLDPIVARSNTFEMEWPPRSGRRQSFPEIDRVEWFPLDAARTRINPAQAELLDRLEELLA
jgi:predicted NUDIX family NTP pyrophosphohydrolase